jgi:hypothetical protein
LNSEVQDLKLKIEAKDQELKVQSLSQQKILSQIGFMRETIEEFTDMEKDHKQ